MVWAFTILLLCTVVGIICVTLFLSNLQKVVSIYVIAPQPVAIVFGAGIQSDGTPSDILEDRLDVAAQLYLDKKVQRILVSGDNSTIDYDEPSNMMRYLVNEKSIPEGDVYTDFAGRRTYDTCARAKEIWGIERAILVTQTYHLPRALMLCSAQGIDVEGVSASLRSYTWSLKYRVREVFAFVQAVIDAYVLHPKYIGGAPETDLDP